MCGICAGISKDNQINSVIEALKKLEYRGYDSSGIAYKKENNIEIIKSIGQISNLERKIPQDLQSNLVIGHTRWATHGKVTEQNAHPHISQDGRYVLVHNGIVENYEKLKAEMKDIDFYSETDTEVFVNLIARQNGSTLQKIISASQKVEGSFAIALLDKNSDEIFFAKRSSPLMVAKNENGTFAGSDMSIFAENFENCYILEDNEFAVLNSKNIIFFNKNGKKIDKNAVFLNKSDFFIESLNEKYYMLKEIKEIPIVLRRTFFKYISEEFFDNFDKRIFDKFKSFHFVACGTAYHSCLVGANYIQQFCKKECLVSIASEFRYGKQKYFKDRLYVFVSQSGETADTIACAKLISEKNLTSLAVTNVPYCSLNNITNFVLPTYAGKEIAVASTKAYCVQVFTLLLFALWLSGKLEESKEIIKKFILDLKVEELRKECVKFVESSDKIFFVGRGVDYITSLEASLKLKEIAYINCLGIPAGELKHGSLALIDENSLAICVSTNENLKEKIESNIKEIQARHGKIVLLSQFEHDLNVNQKITLSNFDQMFMPIVSIIPLQLLAFETAVKFGNNPDKPRNLAKSVTVE